MLPRICLLHANRPDAAYVYVNMGQRKNLRDS